MMTHQPNLLPNQKTHRRKKSFLRNYHSTSRRIYSLIMATPHYIPSRKGLQSLRTLLTISIRLPLERP